MQEKILDTEELAKGLEPDSKGLDTQTESIETENPVVPKPSQAIVSSDPPAPQANLDFVLMN